MVFAPAQVQEVLNSLKCGPLSGLDPAPRLVTDAPIVLGDLTIHVCVFLCCCLAMDRHGPTRPLGLLAICSSVFGIYRVVGGRLLGRYPSHPTQHERP